MRSKGIMNVKEIESNMTIIDKYDKKLFRTIIQLSIALLLLPVASIVSTNLYSTVWE